MYMHASVFDLGERLKISKLLEEYFSNGAIAQVITCAKHVNRVTISHDISNASSMRLQQRH